CPRARRRSSTSRSPCRLERRRHGLTSSRTCLLWAAWDPAIVVGGHLRKGETLRSRLHVLVALAVALTTASVVVSAVGAAADPRADRAHSVVTASDKGKSKLSSKLEQLLESGSTEPIPVFVTASGGVA